MAQMSLDVTDDDPDKLRAKLGGGEYHVSGKGVRGIPNGENLNLLESSVIPKGIDLVQRILSILETTSQHEDGQVENVRAAINVSKPSVSTPMRHQIPGPAIRVAAMSICM